MSPQIPSILVVVRSVGERTEPALLERLNRQLPRHRIKIVREYPFLKALQESYRIALAFGADWTVCLDADIVIRDSAINQIVKIAAGLGDGVFVFNMQVLDKLFGGLRAGGPHVYRTSYLNRAMQYTVNQGGTNRPETYVMRKMTQAGLTMPTIDEVVGVHDYEQYFRDIFRTAYFHSQKHRGHVAYLKSYWTRMSSSDPDFVAALAGYRYSKHAIINAPLDARAYGDATTYLAAAGIHEEKKALSPGGLSPGYSESIIAAARPPREYYQAIRYGQGRLRRPYRAFLAEAAHIKRESGWGGLWRQINATLWT